jgi:hypothetical protein
MSVELDLFEYSSDANAQAAYVTNATEMTNQESTDNDFGQYFGNPGGVETRSGQGFTLSSETLVTAVEVRRHSGTSGVPTGNWTLRIETNNAGVPSGTLANANASIVVVPPAEDAVIKGTFATPFVLSGATIYWIVAECNNQSTNVFWRLTMGTGYTGGTSAIKTSGSWAANANYDFYFKVYSLPAQVFSESTIKTQGSYALKAVAAITDSLNKTLTRTIDPPIDLTGVTKIKYDQRALRAGSNIKIGLHDSGGTTTEFTHNQSADEYETAEVDISAVADADKDAIDSIIITNLNADAANTFYLDNMFGITEHVKTFTDDAFAISEPSIVKSTTRPFAEVMTISEVSITRGLSKTFSEVATLTDIYSRAAMAFIKTYTDTITLSEIYSRSAGLFKTFSENISLVEVSIVKALGKIFSETVTLSESFVRAITKVWAETVTLSEVAARAITMTIAEVMTIADTYTRQWATTKTFTESFTITDVFTKALRWLRVEHVTSSWNKVSKAVSTWVEQVKASTTWTKKTWL